MFKRYGKILSALILAAGICVAGFGSVLATDRQDMGGWEAGSPYNKLYNPAEMDAFKGSVVAIKEVIPMTGMSPGLALQIRESKTETTWVHLCPLWFTNSKGIRIKKGDRVKVNGAWAEINGKDVFMAAKVKRGNYSFKVRMTKDGTPFWTLTPAQLEKERQDK